MANKIKRGSVLKAKKNKIKPQLVVGFLVLLVIIIGTVVVLQLNAKNQDGRSQASMNTDYKSACIESGGEWKQFGNGCADNCDYVNSSEEMMCIAVITQACDCGPDRCWNSQEQSCVPNGVIGKPIYEERNSDEFENTISRKIREEKLSLEKVETSAVADKCPSEKFKERCVIGQGTMGMMECYYTQPSSDGKCSAGKVCGRCMAEIVNIKPIEPPPSGDVVPPGAVGGTGLEECFSKQFKESCVIGQATMGTMECYYTQLNSSGQCLAGKVCGRCTAEIISLDDGGSCKPNGKFCFSSKDCCSGKCHLFSCSPQTPKVKPGSEVKIEIQTTPLPLPPPP